MTNQEINEQVGKKLRFEASCHCAEQGFDCDGHDIPNYCTDIAAAWEIMEHLVSLGYGVSIDHYDAEERTFGERMYCNWHCNISGVKGNAWSDGYGDKAPMAICEAFLMLADEK